MSSSLVLNSNILSKNLMYEKRYKLLIINATPDIISMIITSLFTLFSFNTLLLNMPSIKPPSTNGVSITACFKICNVMIPHAQYKMIRKVFSTRNTMQILAFKEWLSSVTRLSYVCYFLLHTFAEKNNDKDNVTLT